MMEKKCKYCAMIIPEEAKICTHCKKVQGWTTGAKIGLGVFILLFLIVVIPQVDKAPKKTVDNFAKHHIADSPFTFNLEVEKLPSNYKGHDFMSVFQEYNFTLTGKDKFETTAEYKKKLQSIDNRKIYTFRVDKDDVDVSYDSDKEIMTIKVGANKRPLRVMFLPKPVENVPINPFITVELETKKSTYVGSNAFGAKQTIKKYAFEISGIHTVNQNKLSHKFSFKIPINEAKKSNEDVSVLIICAPKNKNNILAFAGADAQKATFNEPVEMSWAILGMNMNLLSIWAYDFKTGKVYHKEPIKL